MFHYKNRRLDTDLSPEETFDQSLQVLEEMKFKVVIKDRYAGLIRAFKRWRLISSGDFISITIKALENGKGAEILVEGELAFGAVFDFGVNNRNIDLFEKLFLEEKKVG